MHFGAHQDLELLALLVAVGALLALTPTLRVPLPILLVAGGAALGFIPGLPDIALPPDLVLVAVLPPLLYSGAFFTSLRELRSNKRPISLLAFGLVGATMAAVGIAAHEWIGLPWAVAFTLGAIVSPTDALAATEITSRLGAPRRIVSLIEGESLINDGTALVLYKAAIGAAVGGTFSLADTSGRIVLNVVGGIAIGLAVGWVVRQVRRRIDEPPVEIAIAVLSGYLAYLPAAAAGVSGVLAAVTIGVYMGWHTPELTTERTRLSGDAFWEILVFLVNALLFVLVGLQLRRIIDALSGISSLKLMGYGALVSAVVILTRIIWVPVFAYLPRWAFPAIRRRDPYPPWQWPALISWVGIRGAVSLVAALALPTNFPDRELIVYLTFAVILATLVIQGLTLPLRDALARDQRRRERRPRGGEGADQGGRSGTRADRGARRRGRRPPADRRAASPCVRLPAGSVPRAPRRRGRRCDRGAVGRVSAGHARAPRRRAGDVADAAQRRGHRRQRHAARATRPRPRGRPARSLEAHDREHDRDDGEHDDAVGEDLRQIGRRQRLAEAERSLVAPQPVVATERQARSEDDRDDRDEVRAAPLDDLREGEPARDQRERRPVPGEERALVREGEPGIRIGSAVIGIGVTRAILRVGLGAHATVSGCSALRLDLGEVVPLELVLRERRQPAGLATHLATPLLLATGLGGMQRIREAPFER